MVVALAVAIWLPFAGVLLEDAAPPTRADAIVVLAGNAPDRLPWAEALRNQGYADLLVVSNEPAHTHGLETTWLALHEAGVSAPELPDSVRSGQRLTGMTSGQTSFPVAPSLFRFERHGESRAWVSELMPHLAKVTDDLCFIKSMYTEAINHDPAVTFFQTGFQLAGRPSIGAWLAYGLGSENRDLPAFVVMISQGSGNPNDQPLADRQPQRGRLPEGERRTAPGHLSRLRYGEVASAAGWSRPPRRRQRAIRYSTPAATAASTT